MVDTIPRFCEFNLTDVHPRLVLGSFWFVDNSVNVKGSWWFVTLFNPCNLIQDLLEVLFEMGPYPRHPVIPPEVNGV